MKGRYLVALKTIYHCVCHRMIFVFLSGRSGAWILVRRICIIVYKEHSFEVQ